MPAGRAAMREIPALKVRQWMDDWRDVVFDPEKRTSRPQKHFYLFSIPAQDLKALTGIKRREADPTKERTSETGIQRRHNERRSEEIQRYVQFGYPWSDLPPAKRESNEFNDLRKPGWLPTAIIVNIRGTRRRLGGGTLATEDAIKISDETDSIAKIALPPSFRGVGWTPTKRGEYPIEVIDGQHRLWAFENFAFDGTYELPVVAFHDLDLSWQAYLFWTINIKPRKINASLAFDLYPLLRQEEWLSRFEGHKVYREARAQELTTAMWTHPESPWHRRINMLGDPGTGQVSQSSWVRGLLSSYVKSAEGPGIKIGGLFGAPVGEDRLILPWDGAQQGAFLITVWKGVRDAVAESPASWAKTLRSQQTIQRVDEDPAFQGEYSLMNTDQGVRSVLLISNDLFFVRSDALKLADWEETEGEEASDETAVARAIQSAGRQEFCAFWQKAAAMLAEFDWRTSSAPGLSDDQRAMQLGYRGSSGYREIWRRVINRMAEDGKGQVKDAARKVLRESGEAN